jgi:putative transposase
MLEYRRWRQAGPTYFFTVTTADRRPILAREDVFQLLREAFVRVRTAHPFSVDAIVVLPDHLHVIWSLPRGDDDFPQRWRLIKTNFTRAYRRLGRAEPARSESRRRHGERNVWQRRYWEHLIRDMDDLRRRVEYIHYNPVKHGHVSCPHAWPWSSFHRWVRAAAYEPDWACACPRNPGRRAVTVPDLIAGE